jgi:hypothetical protein
MKRVWKISPGDHANALDYFENQNYAGIGWEQLKDIRKYRSKDAIKTELKKSGCGPGAASQIWRFLKDISKGDIVFLYGNKQIYSFGEVIGNYYFQKKSDYQKNYLNPKYTRHYHIPHRRKVKWKILFSPFPVDNLPENIVKKLGQRNTIREFTEDWPIIKRHIDTYGERNPNINCGLSHEPENEQQVIAMFTRYFDKLGFSKILNIYHERHPSPDAEALTRDGKHVLIEFELNSSNAKNHGQQLNNWDYLVCWEHDWKNYHYEAKIIELKKELRRILK